MDTIDNQAAIEAVFHTYFNDGYFESRSGEICLTLYPKRWAWLPSDKQKAWDAVVAKFSDDPRWDHTDVMLSLIHISEPTRLHKVSRMPSSA